MNAEERYQQLSDAFSELHTMMVGTGLVPDQLNFTYIDGTLVSEPVFPVQMIAINYRVDWGDKHSAAVKTLMGAGLQEPEGEVLVYQVSVGHRVFLADNAYEAVESMCDSLLELSVKIGRDLGYPKRPKVELELGEPGALRSVLPDDPDTYDKAMPPQNLRALRDLSDRMLEADGERPEMFACDDCDRRQFCARVYEPDTAGVRGCFIGRKGMSDAQAD